MREIKFRAWDKETNEMLDMVTVACERKNPWPPLYSKGRIDKKMNEKVKLTREQAVAIEYFR